MDLRIIKTHKAIRDAFIDLLSEQEYDEITIQDILNKGLVNRATFYKYYAGKSDLAGQMITDFRQKIEQLLNDRLTADVQMLEIIMDNHGQTIFEIRKQMLALWKIRTKKHNLYQDMFGMLKQNFIVLAQQKTDDMPLPKNLDYQATIMATMFMTTLKYYFEQDLPIPKNLPDDWQQMIDIAKI